MNSSNIERWRQSLYGAKSLLILLIEEIVLTRLKAEDLSQKPTSLGFFTARKLGVDRRDQLLS